MNYKSHSKLHSYQQQLLLNSAKAWQNQNQVPPASQVETMKDSTSPSYYTEQFTTNARQTMESSRRQSQQPETISFKDRHPLSPKIMPLQDSEKATDTSFSRNNALGTAPTEDEHDTVPCEMRAIPKSQPTFASKLEVMREARSFHQEDEYQSRHLQYTQGQNL